MTIGAMDYVSSEAQITSFDFAIPAATGTINNTDHTVAITVPNGTDVTSLTPTIAVSTGATVSPASGTPQNFTSPVTYTVTAQDAVTTQTYTVTVTVAPSSDATLTNLTIGSGSLTPAFSSGTTSYTDSVANGVTSVTVTPTANQANATIKVNGTTVSSGSPSGSISLNVGSNTITTVVTAQDGVTTDTYTITVTRAGSSAKAITAFDFNGLSPSVTGVVTEASHTIALTVPYGTAVTALVPTITITGASVSPASGVAHNFTIPATYTVTAEDSSTVDYTVTVTVASPTTYTITASAGAHGSISPSGAVSVNSGASQSFTITADSGYHVSDVLVDNVSVGAQTSYTFSNVATAHTVSATFAIDTATSATGGGGLLAAALLPLMAPPATPDNPQGEFRIAINNGAAVAHDRIVTLTFSAGNDAKRMAISNSADFIGAGQEDYQPARQWDLCSKFSGFIRQPTCPDGVYTVYIRFYSAWGQPSQVVSDSIVVNAGTPNLATGNTVETTPQPTTSSSAVFTQTLQYGSDGNLVTVLQNKLKQLGFFPIDIASNGHFGPATLKAVQKFQIKNRITKPGIYGYGIVGPLTRLALNKLSK